VNRWQAVVFDLDDTLYPEREYVLSGFAAVARWAEQRLGIAADFAYAELSALFEQGVRGDTFNRWAAAHDLAADHVAEMVAAYREHQPSLAPFPGTTQLLEMLRGHYRLGIVSDGYLEVQRRKLAGLGVAHYFAAVVFSDEFGRAAWKPSPLSFEVVLQRLGVSATQAVYVADNPAKDFLGARRAGMASIWLRRQGGEYTRLVPASPEHAPDITVATLAELAGALSVSYEQASELAQA
jgi:putative hydrolase of the HAD superfamily